MFLDGTKPILTNDILAESLKITNSYCLQGIEHNNKLNGSSENGTNGDHEDDMDETDKKIAGLESVVSVLEEVLIWPAKYPTIFEKSPLRNQAGVLLFGPPGKIKSSIYFLIIDQLIWAK